MQFPKNRIQPRRFRVLLLCAATGIVLCTAVQAQRPPKEEEAPPMVVFSTRASGAPRGVGGMKVESRQLTPAEQQRAKEEMRRLQAMTPQQRDQYFQNMQAKMEQRRQDGLRDALAKVGVEDAAAQDLIFQFIREQQELRVPLDKQRMDLAQALINGAVTDATAPARQKTLSDAVEAARQKYAVALNALDQKVEFSKKPRLKALLMTAGVLDDTEGFVMGPGGLDSVVPFQPPMPGMMNEDE
jgi:hypothetical protein